MDKNIYDLLNDTQTNLSDYNNLQLNDLEKEKMKKFIKNNTDANTTVNSKRVKNTIVAAAAVAIFTISGITGVAATSLQNPISYKIANFMGIDKSLESYETVVGQSVTKENITITVNEVILNQDELFVSVTSTSPDYTSDQFSGPGGRIFINGLEINNGSSWELRELDEHTVQSVIRFPLDASYTGELDVKLTLSTPLIGEVMSRSPHWNFEFKTSGDELSKQTTILDLNKTFELSNNSTLELISYNENAITSSISYIVSDIFSEGLPVITATTEKGETVEFSLNGVINKTGKFYADSADMDILKSANQLTFTVVYGQDTTFESFSINK